MRVVDVSTLLQLHTLHCNLTRQMEHFLNALTFFHFRRLIGRLIILRNHGNVCSGEHIQIEDLDYFEFLKNECKYI